MSHTTSNHQHPKPAKHISASGTAKAGPLKSGTAERSVKHNVYAQNAATAAVKKNLRAAQSDNSAV